MNTWYSPSHFRCKNTYRPGLQPDKRIVALHNSDEEIGSLSSRQIIEDESTKGHRRSWSLNLLPKAARALKTWAKRGGDFSRYHPSAVQPMQVQITKKDSAINEAAHQILYLHGITDLA